MAVSPNKKWRQLLRCFLSFEVLDEMRRLALEIFTSGSLSGEWLQQKIPRTCTTANNKGFGQILQALHLILICFCRARADESRYATHVRVCPGVSNQGSTHEHVCVFLVFPTVDGVVRKGIGAKVRAGVPTLFSSRVETVPHQIGGWWGSCALWRELPHTRAMG